MLSPEKEPIKNKIELKKGLSNLLRNFMTNPYKVGNLNKIVKVGNTECYPESYLKMIIGITQNIPATTSPAERLFIFEQAMDSVKLGNFLEVGSYLGATAVLLAEVLKKHSKNARLFCIDTWQNDAMSEGRRDTFEEFSSNIYLWKDIIEAIRGESHSVEISFHEQLDLIFIDADHSYEGCKGDVERFTPLLREGGRLILDDHVSFTGVTKVVGELLISGNWYVKGSFRNVICLQKDTKSQKKERRT